SPPRSARRPPARNGPCHAAPGPGDRRGRGGLSRPSRRNPRRCATATRRGPPASPTGRPGATTARRAADVRPPASPSPRRPACQSRAGRTYLIPPTPPAFASVLPPTLDEVGDRADVVHRDDRGPHPLPAVDLLRGPPGQVGPGRHGQGELDRTEHHRPRPLPAAEVLPLLLRRLLLLRHRGLLLAPPPPCSGRPRLSRDLRPWNGRRTRVRLGVRGDRR